MGEGGVVSGQLGRTGPLLPQWISGTELRWSGWQHVPITYRAVLLAGSGFWTYNIHTGTTLRLTVGDFTQALFTSTVMAEEILESKEGIIRVCLSGLFPGVFEHICVFRSSLELEELEKNKNCYSYLL